MSSLLKVWNMSADEFGSGSLLDEEYESSPSVSFRDAKVGQKLVVKIVELPTKEIQRKDFTSKEPKFWPLRPGEAGPPRPMLNTFTKFEILEGSDVWTKNAEDDDLDPAHDVGKQYNWWTNKPSQGWAEFVVKHKLLGQKPGEMFVYKKQPYGAEWDKFRKGLGRGFRVGDVIELKFAGKRKIEGQSPQKLYEITYLRTEAPVEPSLFDEADE